MKSRCAGGRRKAGIAKERERLVAPAAAEEVAKLAPRYRSAALGELRVVRRKGGVGFDFGEWKSAVASRKNDDGAISFLSIDPAERRLRVRRGAARRQARSRHP